MNGNTPSKFISDICDLLINELQRHPVIGPKEWYYPDGGHNVNIVHELVGSRGTLWSATTEWTNKSGDKRRVILVDYPITDQKKRLTPIFELAISYKDNSQTNTQVTQIGNIIEIRLRGKFTIGRGSLRKGWFFDYLEENGYNHEIMGNGKELYIRIFRIKDWKINTKHFVDRLIDVTRLVDEYKSYHRMLRKGSK